MTQSTDQKFDIAAAMKGQQWERCKGELMALLALQGSYHSATLPSAPEGWSGQRLKGCRKEIGKFIKIMEDEGFSE